MKEEQEQELQQMRAAGVWSTSWSSLVGRPWSIESPPSPHRTVEILYSVDAKVGGGFYGWVVFGRFCDGQPCRRPLRLCVAVDRCRPLHILFIYIVSFCISKLFNAGMFLLLFFFMFTV